MNIFEFMGESPILTFFLGYFILKLVVSVFRAITIWINGYPPMWCDSFGRFPDNTHKDTDNAQS
ncbi:hypothetical protein VPZ60_004230 [Salmonella enterica]|nr:hypothetical protein [Salmonella enterica]